MHIRRLITHRFGYPLVIAMATAGLLAAGCSSQSDIQQLNQNEFTLRGMIASDRQQIDSLQQQVRQLHDQITEMQHGGNATGTSDQLAAANDKISKLQTEVSALQAGLAAQPGAVAMGTTPGAPTMAGGPPPETGAPAVAAPTEPPATWPQELDQEISNAESSRDPGVKLYRSGLKAMKDGKYPLAVAEFTRLQHQYPKSPLVEPADYFAANALYETGKYDQAILEFNDLVMRYPRGRFAAQALLRQAEAFLKMNDRIDARLTLQKLKSDHGGTPQAAAADTMMASLSE